jgi:hypothetical protein
MHGADKEDLAAARSSVRIPAGEAAGPSHYRTCQGGLTMSVRGGKAEVPFKWGHFRVRPNPDIGDLPGQASKKRAMLTLAYGCRESPGVAQDSLSAFASLQLRPRR